MNYDDLDPFDVFVSALALGLVSNLTLEELWIACNISESSEDFDVSIQAACELNELVRRHYSGENK
jgi:hypothetical protein